MKKQLTKKLERLQHQIGVIEESLNQKNATFMSGVMKDVDWMKSQIEGLTKFLNEKVISDEPSQVIPEGVFEKVQTFLIFESYIWMTCGLDEDSEWLLRSFLYPMIYEDVIRGRELFYLDEEPERFQEACQKTVRFLKELEEESDLPFLQDERYLEIEHRVRVHLIKDVLQLFYNGYDPEWISRESLGSRLSKKLIKDQTLLPYVSDINHLVSLYRGEIEDEE